MKRYSAGLLILLCNTLYAPEETDKNKSYSPIPGLYVHFNTNFDNKAEAKSAVHTEQTQKTETHQTTFINGLLPLPDKKSVTTWLATNKLSIVGVSAVSIYAIVLASYLRASHHIKKNAYWCHWKNNLTMQELQAYTYNQLGKELMYTIQTTYFDPKHPTNFIIPCVQFTIALDKEEACCNQLLSYYTWINYCKLGRLFGISTETITTIESYKQRLAFIRHIFISWVADSNIQQSMAQGPVKAIES